MSTTTNGKAAVLSAKQKPVKIVPRPDQIPESLQILAPWTGWDYKRNTKLGKWDKPPIDVKTRKLGSSTNPEKWCSFASAHACMVTNQVYGIGVILGELDGDLHLSGIDLDDCRDPATGELNDLAKSIIQKMQTYTEVSPSGTGIKIFCFANLPEKHRTENSAGTVEIYSRGRYFTITGQQVEGTPLKVEKRQAELEAVWQEYIGSEVPAKKTKATKAATGTGVHAACLAAMRVATKNMPDGENDGSKRLVAVACRCVEHDLSDDQAIATIRKYEVDRPFPGQWTDEDILKRVRDAEQKVERGFADDEDKRGFVHIMSDEICDSNSFARDAAGRLYRFSEGVYRSKAEHYVRSQVKRLCIEWEKSAAWSRKLSDEVVAFIAIDAPELWDRPRLDLVNVKNGLLRLADGVLLPHTPDHLSTIQLPVAYDPKATCPAIDKFVSEVFPPDAIDLAHELPAWLMTPDISIQKAVLLLGEGGNGKSTYLAMLLSFLGRGNCVGLSLHKLEGDKFAIARLHGKLANICPDLPTEHLSGTSVFKSITGGDFGLEAEIKFRDGFSFDPFCRLIFSANSPPRSADASEGFFDRWLVVPFDARFRGTDREITRQELDAKLSAPSELSGFLNKAVTAWRAIRSRGTRLSEPQSVRDAWADFHSATDPLSVWLDRYTIDDPDAVVPVQVLRTAYGAACDQAGRPTPSQKNFGHSIRKARSGVERLQRVINGRLQWCYVGIGMTGEPVGDSPDSLDSLDNPISFSRGEPREESEESNKAQGELISGHPVNPVNPVNGDDQQEHWFE